MADDEFNNLGSGKYWWDASSSRTAAPSISTTLNAAAIPSFGWPREAAPPGGHDQSSTANPNLQIMGLGLISSQPIHWNVQTLFRGEKAESSFRPMLEEDHHLSSSSNINTSNNFDEQERWRSHEKLYSGGGSPEESSVSDFKKMNHHHHHHHHQFSPLATSNDESTITSSSHNLTAAGTFHQTEYSSAAYGLLLSENQQQPMNNNNNNNNNNYLYPSSGYGEILPPSWNNNNNNSKFPPKPEEAAPSSSLHFTNNNNTPFWNASPQPNEAARSSFFPTLQTKVSAAPSFDEKPKNTLEARDFSTKTTTKIKSSSSNTETSNNNNNNNKRPRNETPTPLPAFKVRKEKMGDRITALQQLVSPFGKTDTASVLSDAIEYIKFLHDQISALSDPYMKNAASIQHRHQLQNRVNKSKDGEGGRDQDLRSRGLCLVPVSSTFPVAHETTVDFWTPTFGGATFR